MSLFLRPEPGAKLNALLNARKPLEALYEPWLNGASIERARLERLHEAATVAAHAFYVDAIPVYRQLAEELGLIECDDAQMIRTEMASSDHLFKSYPQEMIDAGDYLGLTDWVAQITSDRPTPELKGVDSIDSWLSAMHRSGWLLNYSSGTSGHLSFTPREELTERAHIRYTVQQWTHMGGRDALRLEDFDGYFMVFAGGYQMISAQGFLLARQCARADFIYPEPSSADLTRLSVRGAKSDSQAQTLAEFRARTGGQLEAHCTRILDGMLASAKAGRPILLYAPPFQLLDLCHRMEERGEAIPPQSSAILLTGGGWKSFEQQRIARDELLTYAQARLGFQAHQMHEGYGQSECNAHFNRCAHGRFHVPPLALPMVLDANQEILANGGVGRYGFCDPFITAYPGFVISGDQVELVYDDCPCGLTGASIVGEVQRAKGQEVKGCGGVMAATRA